MGCSRRRSGTSVAGAIPDGLVAPASPSAPDGQELSVTMANPLFAAMVGPARRVAGGGLPEGSQSPEIEPPEFGEEQVLGRSLVRHLLWQTVIRSSWLSGGVRGCGNCRVSDRADRGRRPCAGNRRPASRAAWTRSSSTNEVSATTALRSARGPTAIASKRRQRPGVRSSLARIWIEAWVLWR
jgi:hypothetical protein